MDARGNPTLPRLVASPLGSIEDPGTVFEEGLGAAMIFSNTLPRNLVHRCFTGITSQSR